MDKKMVENIKKKIQANKTEYLQQIWNANDRNEFSDEAFEAIRQILEERGENTVDTIQKKQPEKVYTTSTQAGGFFSFRIMISRTLIQIFYVLGALILSVSGFIIISMFIQDMLLMQQVGDAWGFFCLEIWSGE